MTETPVVFGPQSGLFGVLTQPPSPRAVECAFLMLNAGVVSHIGPHRMNVKLARALASAGEASFRFDLSGHGDSENAQTSAGFLEQAASDIQSAMDHLEKEHGIRKFALIGICSGAVSAFETALKDSRVIALLMFDGYWYPSRWSTLARDWQRFRAITWSQAASAFLRRIAQKFIPSKHQTSEGIFGGKKAPFNLPHVAFANAIEALVKRRASIFIVYGGSIIEQYSYSNQFHHVFGQEAPFDQVRCEFHPEMDHIFVSPVSQQAMIETVLGWRADVHLAADHSPLGEIDDSPTPTRRPAHLTLAGGS
ncbi:MAG: alpha/beta fold hydrolase [Hydrogenophaga sp.]